MNKPVANKTISTTTASRARDIDVIRQERELMLMPGLFVMGGDGRTRTITEQVKGGTVSITFNPLSAYDLRVLLGLVALAQGGTANAMPVTFESSDETDEGIAAWTALGEKARESGGRVTRLSSSRRQLAEMILDHEKSVGGRDLDRIMDSLANLNRVQIHYKSADRKSEYITNLIAGAARRNDKLMVSLNPRLVRAVVERSGGGTWAMLSIHSLRTLSSDAAIFLYHRLCAVMDMGNTLKFWQSTLESYVWLLQVPDNAEASAVKKKRRQLLTKALNEMSRLSPAWMIEEIKPAKRGGEWAWKIKRPHHPKAKDAKGQITLDLDGAGSVIENVMDVLVDTELDRSVKKAD